VLNHVDIETETVRTVRGYPFHLIGLAAFCGSQSILKYLTLNSVRVDRETISYAIQGGHEQTIAFLSEQGHSFDRQLWNAIRYHQNRVAFWLMDNFECEHIELPFCVCWFNTEMFLFFLIEEKRDINERWAIESTSLMWAARYNNIALARFILSIDGVDASAKDSNGRTALDYAPTNEMRAIISERTLV
jgi:hypothetical protein